MLVQFTILGFFKLEHQQWLKITKAYGYDLEGEVMQRFGIYAGGGNSGMSARTAAELYLLLKVTTNVQQRCVSRNKS